MNAVILRGCDFFDFAKISPLKTNDLRAKKSRIFNKVTNSEQSEGSLHLCLQRQILRAA